MGAGAPDDGCVSRDRRLFFAHRRPRVEEALADLGMGGPRSRGRRPPHCVPLAGVVVGGVSLADQACAGILVVAAFVALVSALVLVANVFEGNGVWAWVSAVFFFGSSFGAAWCFRELV